MIAQKKLSSQQTQEEAEPEEQNEEIPEEPKTFHSVGPPVPARVKSPLRRSTGISLGSSRTANDPQNTE